MYPQALAGLAPFYTQVFSGEDGVWSGRSADIQMRAGTSRRPARAQRFPVLRRDRGRIPDRDSPLNILGANLAPELEQAGL
jgi:hypothetical protein